MRTRPGFESDADYEEWLRDSGTPPGDFLDSVLADFDANSYPLDFEEYLKLYRQRMGGGNEQRYQLLWVCARDYN